MELIQPTLRRYFILFFLDTGVFYMYEAGLIRPAIFASFGYGGTSQSYAIAVIMLIAAASVYMLDKIRKKITDTNGIILLNIVLAISFLLASLKLGLALGFIVMTFVAVVGNLAYPWISVIVNEQISSQYRATTLSTLSFFTKLPYVVMAIFAGEMMQQGKLSAFNIGVGLFIIIILIVNELVFRWFDRKAVVTVEENKSRK
jgi:hypothetical protein